jgi:hypothetical protein
MKPIYAIGLKNLRRDLQHRVRRCLAKRAKAQIRRGKPFHCRLGVRPKEAKNPIPLSDSLMRRKISHRLCFHSRVGGYVMPDTAPDAGQTALPADLEQAAVEQCAYWFQNRDKLGLLRHRPNQGTYIQLASLDLLPSVAAVLNRYTRWRI